MLVTRELMAILHVLAGIPSRSGGCYSTRRAHVTKYCSSDRLTRQAAGWIRRVLRTSIRVFARQVIDIHRSRWESKCDITPLGCLFDDACDAEQSVALPTNALLSIRVRCARRCRACVSVHDNEDHNEQRAGDFELCICEPLPRRIIARRRASRGEGRIIGAVFSCAPRCRDQCSARCVHARQFRIGWWPGLDVEDVTGDFANSQLLPDTVRRSRRWSTRP